MQLLLDALASEANVAFAIVSTMEIGLSHKGNIIDEHDPYALEHILESSRLRNNSLGSGIRTVLVMVMVMKR